MKYLLSTYTGLLLGALAGALVGFAVQQVTNQAGWSLTLGSLGACLGAMWAAMRRADGKLLWRTRAPAEPAPAEPPPAASNPGD